MASESALDRLTGATRLVIVLGDCWPYVYHSFDHTRAIFSFVGPLVAPERLPCLDCLSRLTVANHRLCHINADILEDIVATEHAEKVAATCDIVEDECIGAGERCAELDTAIFEDGVGRRG